MSSQYGVPHQLLETTSDASAFASLSATFLFFLKMNSESKRTKTTIRIKSITFWSCSFHSVRLKQTLFTICTVILNKPFSLADLFLKEHARRCANS